MDNFIAHILVVDDDDGIRSLVKKYLNENDYLVTTANSAEDANEKINIIKFDLIILDIMMPGKSGLEFIQENQKKLKTPIILLTAKGQANERIEGLEIGADDYLPKPFEPKELILRIQNIINKIKEKLDKIGKSSDVKFVVHDTLCRQVSGREPQLKVFAQENDVIIFVSGTKSSNGKMLFLSCKDQNKNSYFVSDIKEIQKKWFNESSSVGICGATSTPRWLMDEVAEYIRQFS